MIHSSVRTLAVVAAFGVSVSTVSAVTVINGTFNDNAAGYTVWPGYSGSIGGLGVATNPAAPTGWTVSAAGTGINSDAVIAVDSIAGNNGVGGANNAFIDNGLETDAVLVLQGVASVSQNVAGFIIGQNYVLTFDVNARNCCGDVPQGQLSIGGSVVIPFTSISPVGAGAPYDTVTVPFTAPAGSLDFLIESRPAAGGDTSMLVDNFAIALVPEPSTFAALFAGLGMMWRRRR